MKSHQSLFVSLAAFILLSACSTGGTVSINNQSSSDSGGVIGVQKLNVLMPAGKELVDPQHGKEMELAYGAVTGENGTLANGVATAHYFQDGSTNIGLQVNIADAKEGTYYDAWLESADGSQPINMGQLTAAAGDVRHSLTFDSKDNLSKYAKIIITLQQNGGSQTPGQTVASVTLQATSR